MLLATPATHFSSKCLELCFYILNCLHLGLQVASCLNAHVWEHEPQAWTQTLRYCQEKVLYCQIKTKPRKQLQLGVVTHAHNPKDQEAKAGGMAKLRD